MDTIVTLGNLSLPFYGHCDDSKYRSKVGECSTGGVGNFVEFLQFTVRGEYKVLEHQVILSYIQVIYKLYSSYIPKTSQNDLISCCG